MATLDSANLTNIDKLLKTTYEPEMRYQLNNENVLLAQMEKIQSIADSGNNIIVGVQTGNNEGFGALSDGDDLPTANYAKYAQLTVPMKYLYARLQISGPAMDASRDNAGAFAKVLVNEKKSTVQTCKDNLNRILYGSGTGQLTTCTGANTSTSVPVASTKYLKVGAYVDIIDTDGSTVNADGKQITAVDPVGLTITLEAAPGIATANGDVIVRKDSLNKEPYGLESLVDTDNTLMSCNRALAANSYFRSYVLAATGGLLDEMEMQKVIDEINIASGKSVNLLITTHGVRRKYAQLLTPDKRYNDTVELKGGFKTLSYGDGLALMVDKDCPAGIMYFLVKEALEEHYMADWKWMSEDGNILSRVNNKHAYEATIYKSVQFVTNQANALGKLTGITE